MCLNYSVTFNEIVILTELIQPRTQLLSKLVIVFILVPVRRKIIQLHVRLEQTYGVAVSAAFTALIVAFNLVIQLFQSGCPGSFRTKDQQFNDYFLAFRVNRSTSTTLHVFCFNHVTTKDCIYWLGCLCCMNRFINV